jgi:signal transduction histidine kinase/CheY-like chemotaxis protein
MNDSLGCSIFTLRLRHERHVVHARQRTRDVASLLGFEHQDQIRLATAASELARNAFRYATGGVVEFLVRDSDPRLFVIAVSDEGPGIPNLDEILDGQYVSKTGLGKGLIGTRRLMDHFNIVSSATGTRVEAGKLLPVNAPGVDANRLKLIQGELANGNAADPFDEIERQNQELLKTLAELREKQDLLAELNRELEDTNRGVVALYAELDQNADDLRRVSDLKTSFLSNLSHEFRTPLNSITSLSRLLLGRSDGDLSIEQEKQVTYIQRSASDLSELVNDLLDLAKVEAGKIDIKARHFEVQDLFGALRGMLKPLMAGNSLDLIFDANPDIGPLYTDEGKVSQILRNLISNALKFTRRGQVRVTAELGSPDLVMFRVSDTGIGIAPEDLERIFEEFVQIESEMQAKVKGTGLGLPLSRRLAELLGGSLHVESELGAGSTFTVTVPKYFGSEESPRSRSANPQASGATILFVEDNRETSFVHETSLKNSNYRLVFTANIPEARAAMKQCAPALVVLDRLIDEQDCLFYIGELKAQGFGGPVLVVSVIDDPKSAMSAGADAFLAKPVAPFVLLNTVRELVDGRTSKTVLLVDDDEVTRYLLGESLVNLGYRILEAHNGREAIRIAESHIPDVMVLDIIMPDLSGFEVLREIRSRSLTRAIPVVVHTSKDLSAQELAMLANMRALVYPKQAFSSGKDLDTLRQILDSAGTGA